MAVVTIVPATWFTRGMWITAGLATVTLSNAVYHKH